MNTKQIILLILWVAGLVTLANKYTRYRAVSKPVSQSLTRIYGTQTCLQMQSIHRKHRLCRLLKRVAELVVFSLMLIFDVYALIAGRFGNGFFESVLPVLAFYAVTMMIVGRLFNDEKKKATVKMSIISFVITLLIGVIVSFMIKLYDDINWIFGILMLFLIYLVITILFDYIAIFISWIDYRRGKWEFQFIPECDKADLQSKFCNLFARYGYKVNKITIKSIDTSQNDNVLSRKTLHEHIKINPFGDTFSQTTKEVVISEHLMDTMTEDEICAICSYLLYSKILLPGYRGQKYESFRFLVSIGAILTVALFLLFLLLENMERVCFDFGFNRVNYGFLAALVLVIYKVISSWIANVVVWCTERSADIRVCNDGYADAWISVLEKLEGDKKFEINSLAPSLLERINAIDKYKSKLNKRKK